MDGFKIKTNIKKSNIQNAGLGRFSLEECSPHSLIRVQKNNVNIYIYKNESEFAENFSDGISRFYHTSSHYSKIGKNYVYLNFPPMYTNHSADPNISFIYYDDIKITFAFKHIKTGDELVNNYLEYSKVDWFEKFLNKKNKISLRQMALNI